MAADPQIGIAYVGPLYAVSNSQPTQTEDALYSIVTTIGADAIKLFIGNEYATWFPNDTLSPTPTTLKTMLQADPIKDVLDSNDITTFVLNCFTFINDGDQDKWKFGWEDQPTFLADEEAEINEAADYLLSEYDDTGKRFILSTWEGDWALLASTDPTDDVPTRREQLMQAYLRSRQRGVERARRDSSSTNVIVENCVEVNRVVETLNNPNLRRVVTKVLPFIHCDVVSYSAYDSINDGSSTQADIEDFFNDKFPQALAAIRAAAPRSEVIVGEFGWPEEEVSYNVGNVLATFHTLCEAQDIDLVIYWQLWDNEAGAGPPTYRGFWCENNSGALTEAGNKIKDLVA